MPTELCLIIVPPQVIGAWAERDQGLREYRFHVEERRDELAFRSALMGNGELPVGEGEDAS